jgi:hypothetical protein
VPHLLDKRASIGDLCVGSMLKGSSQDPHGGIVSVGARPREIC